LRWPSAPQSDVRLRTERWPHVATSFPPCFPHRPCLTTQSGKRPTCSTPSRADCKNLLGNAVRHSLCKHLEARHQRRLTGKDRHLAQPQVSIFVRVPATADYFNLALPSHSESEPIRDDNGTDSLKGGDTTKTGVSYYITYPQLFTNKPR
jgi:hypothetical protein